MTAQVLELFPEQSASPPIKPPKKPPTKKEKYTPEFEAFWTLYPRKLNCSKLMAFKAWCRLDDDEQGQAMSALPTFCLQMRGKDEQYIPHAATWLNQKRFETVVVPSAVPSASAPSVDWTKAVQIYNATGRWNSDLGPEPGRKDYRGPK